MAFPKYPLTALIAIVLSIAATCATANHVLGTDIIDLEALPGEDTRSEAWAVNSDGVIVGYSGLEAVRWNPGGGTWTVEALGVAGIAAGINESGQVCISSDAIVAVLWDSGTATPLSSPFGLSNCRGINNLGDVVGTAIVSFSPFEVRAAVWKSGLPMEALPPLESGDFSSAFAINDLGEIVGSSNKIPGGPAVPTMWLPDGGGGYITLELANTISGSDTGFGRAISNNGLISGFSTDARPASWSVYDPTTENILATPDPADPLGAANGVNESGELVGYAGRNGEEPRPTYWPDVGETGHWLMDDGMFGFSRAISNRAGGQAYIVGFHYTDPTLPNQQAFVTVLEGGQNDSDGDGVEDSLDACPDTRDGDAVDPSGCSVNQLCPCEGPYGESEPWRYHGQYVSCVARTANWFARNDWISPSDVAALVSEAANSSCGY